MLTGLLNVIPVLGAAVSIVLAILVAAIDSWGRVLGVAIFFFVYLQIENSWLIPRIMKSRVNLPALAIFVALLLGSALEGILGAMVAIPTAVLVSVLLDEYLVRKDDSVGFPRFAVLRGLSGICAVLLQPALRRPAGASPPAPRSCPCRGSPALPG